MKLKLRCFFCKDEHNADTYHFPKYILTPVMDKEKKVIGQTVTGYVCRKCIWKDERGMLIKQFNIHRGVRRINDVLNEKLQELKNKEEARRDKCERVSPSTNLKKLVSTPWTTSLRKNVAKFFTTLRNIPRIRSR